MSGIVTEPNPIQGLLNYIADVKPYHTKVVQILAEYVHEDLLNVTITEDFVMQVNLVYPSIAEQNAVINNQDPDLNLEFQQLGTFGGLTPFGGPQAWPVLSPDFTSLGTFDPSALGYDHTNNFIVLPGDRTQQYTDGKSIIVNIYDSNNNNLLDSRIYTITTSVYSLPNTPTEIQHTVLNIATTPTNPNGLEDAANFSPPSVNQMYVTVELTPFVIDSVVYGYGGASEVFYTDVPPNTTDVGDLPVPTPADTFAGIPTETFYDEFTPPTAVNSFVVAGDVKATFIPGSIIELVGSSRVFTVLYARYDATPDVTTIRTIETIPTSITSGELKIREILPGFGDVFIENARTDGNMSTNITERITFSWSDPSENDVINGYQFLIKTTTSGSNEVDVNGNAEGVVQIGDSVLIQEAPTNNGVHTVTNVSGSIITLNATLTNAVGGFIELYNP